MENLLIICGHGAGDPGAGANGYQEAERVRALADRIKHFGGDAVTVGDTSKNWYKSNLVNNDNIPKGSKVLELHMDSGSATAKGAHIIIKKGFEADEYDKALAKFLSEMFPGRAETIVGRSDLANPNRAAKAGINYRLAECGFISNDGDLEIFNTKMDEIAKGILACFGISPKEEEKKTAATAKKEKTLAEWAKEVIDGKHGSGHENREKSLKKAGCPYAYEKVRAKVNELVGVKPATDSYYPKYTGSSIGIDTVLEAIGVPARYRGGWRNRKPLAAKNGIKSYEGTATQNAKLISLAKQGKLKKV